MFQSPVRVPQHFEQVSGSSSGQSHTVCVTVVEPGCSQGMACKILFLQEGSQLVYRPEMAINAPVPYHFDPWLSSSVGSRRISKVQTCTFIGSATLSSTGCNTTSQIDISTHQ